jgi:hypothetical protein
MFTAEELIAELEKIPAQTEVVLSLRGEYGIPIAEAILSEDGRLHLTEE